MRMTGRTNFVERMMHRALHAGCMMMACLVLALILAQPAAAQRTTSKEVVDCYTQAQKLLEEDKARDALRVIRNCLSKERTADERAVLLRFAAQLEVEVGNINAAVRDIEASFKTGALTELELVENYFFLGRLYLATDPPNFAKAIENLRLFINKSKNPSADAYYYLGQALALSDRYREALPYAQKAIELSKEPKENHYRLLLFCYTQLQQYSQSVPLIERMLTMFPVKDEYLSQLAVGYQELKREKDAFLVQAFRYELGFLDSEGELTGMADLYLSYDNPYRAARLLDKEMKAGRVKKTSKNYEKLGNMWFLAREYNKSRTNLIQAAKTSPKGELDFRIAQTYFEDENWSQAQTYFRRALNKGGLKEACQARVLLAHTLNNMENRQGAIAEFKRVSKTSKCWRDARQWIEYLELQALIELQGIEFDVIRDLNNEYKRVSVDATDDEQAFAVAEEALEAAKAAAEAESPQIRRTKLFEYERARDSALRRLNDGALDKAKTDRVKAQDIVQRAKKIKLSREAEKVVENFDTMSKRRIELLEKATANLAEAEKLAKQARNK